MRRFLWSFLFVGFQLMLILSSCSKDENEASSLSIEYDYTQKVSEKGGSATFSIKTNLGWSISNVDEWITSFEPKQGKGNQTVTVTFAPNNTTSIRSSVFVITAGDLKKEILINQDAGKLPSAAGIISGDNEGFGSVTLTISEIENANTYKWYQDGVEVQNAPEKTYIATTSGTYTVAGANSVGEGQSSPGKAIAIATPVDFESLPAGSFNAIGTPIANVGGYESWDGYVTKKIDGDNQYYIISHWGGPEFNYNVPLLCKNGRLIVDSETLIISDDQTSPGSVYEGYFCAFYIDANNSMQVLDGFSPLYNKEENSISFKGTYDGYPIYVGIIAVLNGEFAGVFSEIYEKARIIITPTNERTHSMQSTPKASNNNMGLIRHTNNNVFKYGSKKLFNPIKFIVE